MSDLKDAKMKKVLKSAMQKYIKSARPETSDMSYAMLENALSCDFITYNI